MFEKASRLKLRFGTAAGQLSAEDLWDLPLSGRGVNLDDIARDLHKKLQGSENISFVKSPATKESFDQLKFDIVKHVIDVRLAEDDKAETARINQGKKKQLLEVLARKESAAVEALSADEIRKMIESL